MKKQAIQNTAITYWSNEDECFVVESPLCQQIAGVGDTYAEARKCFATMLDDIYPDIISGNVYEVPGRPTKDIISIHVQVKPETRDAIKMLQSKLKLPSQGDVINFLAFFYERKMNEIFSIGSQPANAFVYSVSEPKSVQLELTAQQVETIVTTVTAGMVKTRKKKSKKRA